MVSALCTTKEELHPPLFATLPKPVLSDDAPTLVTAFTCGGLFEIGAMHAGFRPVLGVEFYPAKGKKDDAVKQRQSKAAADNYERNFGAHILRKSVQDAVRDRDFEKFVQQNGTPNVFHCSPSCTQFSQGNTQGKEDEGDIGAARAVTDAIAQLGFPEIFTLENVEAYKKSQSWGIIRDFLYESGYGVADEVLIASDYGVPQDRKRFIVRTVKGHFVPPLPAKVSKKMGWYDAIADLIEDLPDGELAPWQLKRLPQLVKDLLIDSSPRALLLNGQNASNPEVAHRFDIEPSFSITSGAKWASALLIERNGASDSRITTRNPEEPAWTIRSSIGTDGAGRNRTNTINALVGGRVKKLNARAIARLQSVPDWYELPEQMKDAGPLLGNGVPSMLAFTILESLKPFSEENTMVHAPERPNTNPPIPLHTPVTEEVESTENQALDRYLERRIQQPDDEQERLEFIDPSTINLERGSQTRLSKNEKGIKDFFEKMEAGLWRFDDPNDCPELIELTEDYLVEPDEEDESFEPFWVRAGELIPCIGHTRLEAGTRMLALRPDIKFLVRIKPGTWFDVIRESGTSDVNSAYPKSDKDRKNAARRLIKQLFKRYGSFEAIPRRGKGKAGLDLKEEYGNKTIGEMYGLSYKTVERIYTEVNFNRTVSNYPNGTRVQLVADENDQTLPWYLKSKIGALGIVAEPVPVEGLLIKFDTFSPECVPVKFLALSDAPLPTNPTPEPTNTSSGGGGSSGRRLSKGELKEAAASQGLRTGSQPIPSSPTNLDISPEEAAAEPPTPSPIPYTENKSEETPPLNNTTSTTSSTTTNTWAPEVGEWAQVKDEHELYPGKFVRITTYPHPNRTDVAIVEIQGRHDQRDRIETKFLKPAYEEEEEAPKVTSEDIVREITIGVKQLSPEELTQVLVNAQLSVAHKQAVKAALFDDEDLVEVARTVADNIGRYFPTEIELIEQAVDSVKSIQTN